MLTLELSKFETLLIPIRGTLSFIFNSRNSPTPQHTLCGIKHSLCREMLKAYGGAVVFPKNEQRLPMSKSIGNVISSILAGLKTPQEH